MQGHDTAIVHTWSLAVEEQFYIVWPLVVIVVLARRTGRLLHLASVAIALCVVAVAARSLLWDGGNGTLRAYSGTDTRMDCLLVGSLAAMWMHGRTPGVNHPCIAAISLAAAIGLELRAGRGRVLGRPLACPAADRGRHLVRRAATVRRLRRFGPVRGFSGDGRTASTCGTSRWWGQRLPFPTPTSRRCSGSRLR